MNYWLVKSEPETYSFEDLEKDKKTVWDGVRNFQARAHLKNINTGDTVLVYHTGDQKSIIGIARAIKGGYAEPKDPLWVAVDLAPVKKLKNPVSLAQIKADKRFMDMVLVRASRLSVQPVTSKEFELIMAISEGK